jgi:multiple sugar transport system ATP-binding protein
LVTKYIGKPIIFGIRPEHLSDQVSDPDHVPVSAPIEISEPMGSESIVYFKAGTGNLIARVPGVHLYHPGERLTVQLNMEKVHLFDAQTENIIK